MFCASCGAKLEEGHKFCPSCGKPVTSGQGSGSIVDNTGKSMTAETPEVKEKIYFEGEGELIVKKVEHRGVGRKAASFLAGGPIGYIAFGRDKTHKSKARGRLIVTQKSIYCAGNEYSFDRILSIARTGTIRKSILINLESDADGQRYDIKLEVKTSEPDRLFAGLESAKLSKVGF